MSRVVIDAGVVLKTVLPDPLRESCRALLARLHEEGCQLFAPDLWAYETTSTLSKAVFFGHLTRDEARRALDRIAALGVQLLPPDPAQSRHAFEWTLLLKRSAAYDSFYLALAETLGCDLWTTDRRLSKAVDLPWVRPVSDPNLS